MKNLFTNVSVKNVHNMSKADKKKFNQMVPNAFDLKQEYKVLHLNIKADLFQLDNTFEYFFYDGILFPTLKNFDKNIFRTVYLDDGAYGPLTRGASALIPGILKYKEMTCDIKKNEVVGIEIIGKGLCGVGLSLMSLEEMVNKKEGPGIEIYHFVGDALDQNKII